MSNWTLHEPVSDFTPTTGNATKRQLRIFRQTVNEYDNAGNLDVGIVTPAAITPQVVTSVRLSVLNAVERARRCLLALTDSATLDLLETIVGKIHGGVSLSKEDLYPLILKPVFTLSKAKQKILARFFGDEVGAILDSMNGFYDNASEKYKTSFSHGYVFRMVLMSTILGLNLRRVGVVLGRANVGSYGDSITNWAEWKSPIPAAGTTTFPAYDVLAALTKGSQTMDEGYLRCNVIYAEDPAGTHEGIYMPGGVFRNSDYFTLTYIHEATHLFAAVSDSYYFDKPWQDGGINTGNDNPDDEFGKGGKPLTTRCLFNADSYAWLIYLLGDPKYSES